MKPRKLALLFLAILVAAACPWNDELREYLHARFWSPFARRASTFGKANVRRLDAPYAGMTAAQGDRPLARLRKAYQEMVDLASLRAAVAAARADQSLTRREREEVDLVEAKIEMREGETGDAELRDSAARRLRAFLRTARTPEYLSEARGWLAHIHYLSGEQSAAGKIYLDELNRGDSNLSRETLLTSLRMTYGYDGGPELVEHLDEYFDTPAHAAFAIDMVTNPRWRREGNTRRFERAPNSPETYRRVKELLAKHESLLRAAGGADVLGLLAMRTALSMGDPAGAREIAETVPAGAALRASPDFQWMSASAFFLSRDYAAAEKPLLSLFHSPRAAKAQSAAAAYALCGVYLKTGDVAEQIRYALWLKTANPESEPRTVPSQVSDLSIYWAASGWDLNMLLEAEAPLAALEAFVRGNPNLAGIRFVKYALAVRLSRLGRYQEAADLYLSINANRRAQRLRQLAMLSQAADAPDADTQRRLKGRYEVAAFIAANPDRICFNDSLWDGMQRYALFSAKDFRLTGKERTSLMSAERDLKDSQEERWQAYLILRDVVRDAGASELGRSAAELAIRCVRGIGTERFGREEEIRRADIELTAWLRASRGSKTPGR